MVTNEYVVFALVDDDSEAVLDKIPLRDIEGVEDISRFITTLSCCNQFINSVVISTKASGHNGGRAYYLQADSTDDCAQLAAQLSSLAKSAARGVDGASLLGKLCFTGRGVFESPHFQNIFVILTLAVSATPSDVVCRG